MLCFPSFSSKISSVKLTVVIYRVITFIVFQAYYYPFDHRITLFQPNLK